MMRVPFHQAYISGSEYNFIAQAINNGHLTGDGPFTRQCNELLQSLTGSPNVLLTHSCTAALEMSAILAGIEPDDEIIMPSFTFSSTANAFVLRGGQPVFVDIRKDTLNLDENLIEQAITAKTKAIVPVHYAGVSCEMDTINAIAEAHGLTVIEDAAQGFDSYYKKRHLGSIGHMGTLSFHQTKNLSSGEGGALQVNDSSLLKRAEIIREKGTNRREFILGQTDKYTWVDMGSSFLPSDILAAFLFAQLEKRAFIRSRRLEIYDAYQINLRELDKHGVQRPFAPDTCEHNAHLYYLMLPSTDLRNNLLAYLKERGVGAVFHYVALHSAPAGVKFGRTTAAMPVTNIAASQLIRLPLYPSMTDDQVSYVIEAVCDFFK